MIKKVLIFFGIVSAFCICMACVCLADEIDCSITSSDGYDCGTLLDDDFTTMDYYRTDTVLTVTTQTAMDSIYIRWDTEPGEWTLTVNGKDYTYGQHDYLHEFIELPESASEVKITIKTDKTYITDIYAFSGDVPDWVQTWDDPYTEADILCISTHSDDEVLFLGGLIATYVNGGYRVQVAYLCDFYQTEPYRRHELLNGLWAMGITHYPQLGEFEDVYSEDLETAKTQLDYDAVEEYIVRTIRRFKPQVLVSQDFGGEYGHGEHMLCAAAIADAIEVTADAAQYPDSANTYGTWDVPKTYYHCYDQNTIELDVNVPLEKFGGLTAFEVATNAYLKHESQQWMWFYVSDGTDDGNAAPYNIRDFGLYRTLVGYDTGNDVMENLVSYDQQEAEKEIAKKAEEESASIENESSSEETATVTPEEQLAADQSASTIFTIIAVILGILVVIMIILFIVAAHKRKVKEAARRRRAARAEASQSSVRRTGTSSADRTNTSVRRSSTSSSGTYSQRSTASRTSSGSSTKRVQQVNMDYPSTSRTRSTRNR